MNDDIPTIWGDGVHDDTDGFRALLSKREFRYMAPSRVTVEGEGSSQVITLGGEYILSVSLEALKAEAAGDLHIQWPTSLGTYYPATIIWTSAAGQDEIPS